MKTAIATAALLLAAACGSPGGPSSSDPQPLAPGTAPPSAVSPTPCQPLEGGADGVHMLLKDVRAAAHEGFDRVVFEFEVPSGGTGAIPRYSLRPATPPFTKDPSDEPMTVSGSAFLALNLQGASGVDLTQENYRQVYTGPKELKPGLVVLEELEEQGDFEATINWVFGLNQETCPTVTTLSGPFRIVIDLPAAE